MAMASSILSLSIPTRLHRSFTLLAHRSVQTNRPAGPSRVFLAVVAPSFSPSSLPSNETCRSSSSSTTTTTTMTGKGADDDDYDSSFANDPLFPLPTAENMRRHGMPLLARAAHHARNGRVLLSSSSSSSSSGDNDRRDSIAAYTYHDVLSMSSLLHDVFLSQTKDRTASESATVSSSSSSSGKDPAPPRIAFLCPPGPLYLAAQFAAWSSGSIAVPLCASHARRELAYVLRDCDPALVVDGTSTLEDGRELRMAAREAGVMANYLCLDDVLTSTTTTTDGGGDTRSAIASTSPSTEGRRYALGADGFLQDEDSPALIIYTSGTTGDPKGVVHTHGNLYHQVTDLVTSWGWSSDDSILHFLPLHHVHGVINKLACPVWAGASVEFVRFHPVRIWERLARASENWKKIRNNAEGAARRGSREPTVFMAVPTIYAKMLEVAPDLPEAPSDPSEYMRRSPIRLMVSGSAALPTGVFERWKKLTGYTILERYGMSEFAMALSNPLTPIEKRLPGYVGTPLPSVEAKIVDEDTGDVVPTRTSPTDDSPSSGELCVRGPTVFSEYWRKPHATAAAFDFDGYFKTGDVAEYDPGNGSYHILGRVSADIIKCAGHKLSSLQIERTLLDHPSIVEAVVLGVPDDTYGERVGLICRPRPKEDETLDLKTLQGWCKEHMAKYKIPTRMILTNEDIPKNAMGKVSKKQLVRLFEDEGRVQKI